MSKRDGNRILTLQNVIIAYALGTVENTHRQVL